MVNEKHFYVYLLTNWNNKVMYVGVTNNLERRIYEHKNKLVKGLIQRFLVVISTPSAKLGVNSVRSLFPCAANRKSTSHDISNGIPVFREIFSRSSTTGLISGIPSLLRIASASLSGTPALQLLRNRYLLR
jgi:hypothetical protein